MHLWNARDTTSPMPLLDVLRLSRAPAAAFVVIGLYWGTFAAYVPVIKSNIGASDAMFGLLLLGSAIGLVTSMWLAPRVDRWLGDIGLKTGSILIAFAFLLPALASSPVFFCLSMVLVGTCSGLLDVLMNARVSELEAREGRSLMNANHGMFSVAYAVAALATGVARELDFPPVFMMALVSLIVVFILRPMMVTTVVFEEDNDENSGGYPWWPVLLCGLVVLIAFMSEATVETWSALHIERTLNGGAAEGALGPAMLGITMAIGRLSGQIITEKFRETNVLIWASLLSAGGIILAAVAPVPAIAYLGFAIMGLGVSVIGPIGLALVGQLVRPRYRTEAISKAAVMGFSGFFIAPVLMGLISETYGLRAAFACVSIMLLPVVYLATVIAREKARTVSAAVR